MTKNVKIAIISFFITLGLIVITQAIAEQDQKRTEIARCMTQFSVKTRTDLEYVYNHCAK